ncbi:MAG TPA: glycosyltransferase family 2 protein, partial [Cyanobium sp.]|nr:glycosyltransferase family 2 protein [Cyanobium sp.]
MKIACIMMQKNETLLIDPWLRYHTALFGSEHVYVYDNASTDTAVIRTLQNAETSGVNVFWDYTRQDDFMNKGKIIAGLIKRLDKERPYDFYFPLD